jgi:flagellar secretion chaperone FliS
LAKQGQQAYKQNQVLTNNPGKLVILLYNGAIKFLNIAKSNMDFKTYDVVNTNIQKTQAILEELIGSLDMTQGEISDKLFSIYIYMNRQLIEANIQKDTDKIEQVIAMLGNLRDAWETIAEKAPTKPNSNSEKKASINIST